ncbi:hypothetical protein K1719_024318 [Acacia pycnantha]|nr:hypothetical protein K1719_024318 [Acacia pycnantha]
MCFVSPLFSPKYEMSTFFSETTSFNAVLCGDRSGGEATEFTAAAQKLLTNLQTTTPTISGFYDARKTRVPNNNDTTIYGFAQCIGAITQSDCLACLNSGYSNMQTCLPNSDGRAYAAGCFMRYSTTSFFPDNITIDTIPLVNKQGTNLAYGSTTSIDLYGRTKHHPCLLVRT